VVKSYQKNDFFQSRPGKANAGGLAVEVCCCILKELENSKVQAPAVLKDGEVVGREERDAASKKFQNTSASYFSANSSLSCNPSTLISSDMQR